MEEETTSEFGKGFIYNLILFSKHWWRHQSDLRLNDEMAEKYPENWRKGEIDMWFNGAADHFYEIEIPNKLKDTEIGRLAQELVDEALDRRFMKTTQEEFNAYWKKFEKLAMLIDKELGVEPIEAQFH